MENKWISVLDVMPEHLPEFLWPDEYDDILNDEGKKRHHEHPDSYPVVTIFANGYVCINQRLWCEPSKYGKKEGYYFWRIGTEHAGKPCAWLPIPKYENVRFRR